MSADISMNSNTTNSSVIQNTVGDSAHAAGHEHHEDKSGTVLGFWIYLMSDCLIFATLFATYAVLATGIADGPSSKDIFELPFVLVETFLLLISSFTFGMAMISMREGVQSKVIGWLVVTFLFGLGFLCMEFYEFHKLVDEGFGPARSAFLSAFFTLVGTHGLHVAIGLLWMTIMMLQIRKNGFTAKNSTRMMCLSLFWHFLDLIWICVFSVVYLVGAI